MLYLKKYFFKFKKNLPVLLIRIRRLLFWIPTLTLILGTATTFYLFQSFKLQEEKSQQAEIIKRSNDITERIDLSLANSILKIQNYEESLGLPPTQYTQKEINFLKSLLPHTIFQRLTIFEEKKIKKNKPPDKLLKVLYRLTLANSQLIKSSNDYLNANDLYPKIELMKKQSKLFEVFLYERNQQVRLSVFMRSKIQENVYFFFTSPLLNLFQAGDFNQQDSITVIHQDNGPQWKVYPPQGSQSLQTISITLPSENQAPEDTFYQIRHPLKLSGLPVTLQFQFNPILSNEVSSSSVVLTMGLMVTAVLSFLFYVLITQARRTKELLRVKTLDLEKTASHLQDALEEKTKFLGKISHEIRTPLNMILGMIDLCEEKDTQKHLEHYLKGMRSSGDHLLYMIDDLIDLAKSNVNELHFSMRTINTNTFLSDILKLTGQACFKKNLNFYAQIDENVPANFICDPNRLRQILMNLLRNATKYTVSGHIYFKVSFEKDENSQNGYFVFEISDTGAGIPQDKIGKIFDAFFQVEAKSNLAEGGVGLGLSIVRDLVNKLNGTIQVQSKANQGSVFTVKIQLETIDTETWVESFKPYGSEVKNYILVTDDIYLKKSLNAIATHSKIKMTFLSFDFFLKQNDQYFKKLNIDQVIIDYNDNLTLVDFALKLFYKENIILIGASSRFTEYNSLNVLPKWPLLATDIFYKIGFSARNKDKRDLQVVQTQNEQRTDDHNSIIAQQLKILVADDDTGNLELYKAYFQGTSWQVTYATDGEMAWKYYENSSFDLCILDLRMPLMDGLVVIEKIRDHEKQINKSQIPLLLITADLIAPTKEKAEKHQHVTILTKPIRKNKLLQVIFENSK